MSTTRLSTLHFLGLALLLLLGLSACKEESRLDSTQWQPPSYESMPLAFAPSDSLPAYAQSWHAPHGFRDFVKAWNKDSRQQDGAKRDFIQVLPTEQLPPNLHWQEGMNEPEIGSNQAVKGGNFRLSLQRSYPNTMRALGEGSNNSTRRYLYDDIKLPLVYQHPQTGKLIPGTAKRWAVAEDNKTVYFELDPEARYSNGDPLRTQDYLTALYLYNSPHSVDPEFSSFYLNKMAGISIYSNHIFSVELKAPHALAVLFAVIPEHNTRFYAEFGPDFNSRYQWRIPPTTGGYTPDAEGLRQGSQMRVKRVKDWWAKDRRYTRYACNVDSITYLFITEISKARELFRIGEIDALSMRESVDWYENLEIPELHRGYIQRVKFYNTWPRNCFGIHLNCSKPPFDDKNMRLGMHHAMNIQAVIEQVFRGDFSRSGTYFAGFGPYSNNKIKAREYSPQLARAAFAKAGYTQEGADGILQKEDGTRLQVTLSTRIDPLYANAVSWLKTDAARCGLELNMDSMDDTLFFTNVMQKKPSCSLFSWGFSLPLPIPKTYFHSSLARDAQGRPVLNTNNITATANAELDAAIEALDSITEEAELATAHHHIQELIAEEAAWIPCWTSTFWRFAQWRWVRWPQTENTNFCPPCYFDPTDSHLYWIDSAEKAEIQQAKQEGRSLGEHELNIPLPRP